MAAALELILFVIAKKINMIKTTFFLTLLSLYTIAFCTPEINTIQSEQISSVKKIIIDCYLELLSSTVTPEQFEKELEANDEFDDLEDIHASYFNNGGTFLVLTNGDTVIGS